MPAGMLLSPGDGTTVLPGSCAPIAVPQSTQLFAAEAPCCPSGHKERLGAVSWCGANSGGLLIHSKRSKRLATVFVQT